MEPFPILTHNAPVSNGENSEYTHNMMSQHTMDPAQGLHFVQSPGSDGNKRRRFECDVCHKVFNQSGNLTRHRAVHTKARPFKCHICGKGFAQKSHVKTHQSVHSGHKPFECSMCHKRFGQRGHLNGHLDRHRKEGNDAVEIYHPEDDNKDIPVDVAQVEYSTVPPEAMSLEGYQQPPPSVALSAYYLQQQFLQPQPRSDGLELNPKPTQQYHSQQTQYSQELVQHPMSAGAPQQHNSYPPQPSFQHSHFAYASTALPQHHMSGFTAVSSSPSLAPQYAAHASLSSVPSSSLSLSGAPATPAGSGRSSHYLGLTPQYAAMPSSSFSPSSPLLSVPSSSLASTPSSSFSSATAAAAAAAAATAAWQHHEYQHQVAGDMPSMDSVGSSFSRVDASARAEVQHYGTPVPQPQHNPQLPSLLGAGIRKALAHEQPTDAMRGLLDTIEAQARRNAQDGL